ncbi:acylamino-acid-releasing enzyme [Lasius niger]|uniref:acylaminoacyl-peptidase n=1 Tax=Lasius niger TaxID=67767 RepID=A0A0J7KZQ4_LASNI|nr:acylamino-acid-releasing enzyme [Lasius niger]
MTSAQVKELVNLYKSLAAHPSLSGARILGTASGRLSIQGLWTQRNLERKTDQRFLQKYDLNSDLTPISSGFPIDVTTELMSTLTKNEERRAVLRQAIIDNSTKQFIEIWDKQHFVKNYDLSALDVHGDVYTDVEFRSFEWSPDNAKVLYIAEKKLSKSEPFYKQKPLDKKDKEKKEDEEVTVGNEYIYKPHWGEQLVGKHRSVVVVLDTTTDNITVLSGIPDELSPGQVIWTKDQDVVGVAWKHEPQYLGLIACTNRYSWIFLLKNGEYQTKDITEIKNDGSSLTILDVKGDVIAFLNTSLTQPASLMVGRFKSEAENIGDIARTTITTPMKIDELKGIMYEPNEYIYNNDDSIKQFNFIYFGPKSGKDKSVPFVVVPHGGPHSNFTNIFSLDHSFLVSAGFAIVQVNYRGSTGMGSATVEYLQGKVGDIDVKDCITATQEAIKKYPWLDPERIGLCGGSHGGFLVTHLSGQVPDMYKAVVARNPVVDISIMFGISDIPDCRNTLTKEEKIAYLHNVCAVEAGFSYIISGPWPDNIDMFVKMKKCSPISHIDKVKAPTLICIGTKDLRVPSSQGTMWYNRLKTNKVKTKMLVYEDNHPLSTGPAEIDHIINDCLWLLEHTSIHTEFKDKK